MAKHDAGRVVVRRKRVYGESGHGGSWKIAYADFMTAMMAFFLVMWLLLLVPQQDLKIIAEYFRMPLMEAVSGADADRSRSVIPGGQPSVIPNTYPEPPITPDQRSSLLRLDEGGSQEDRDDVERLENLQRDLENLIEHNPILQQFRPQLLLDMTPDGLRIQILDQQNRPMFATGSAMVQSYMRDILRELAPMLSKLPNAITVSGHTDAMRYASGDRQYSNWELSADRANAARRELVAGGLVENKIKRILGLADTVNLIKEDPMAAVNRRISILVLNRRAERQIDAQNAAGRDEVRLRDHFDRTQAAPDAVSPAVSPAAQGSGPPAPAHEAAQPGDEAAPPAPAGETDQPPASAPASGADPQQAAPLAAPVGPVSSASGSAASRQGEGADAHGRAGKVSRIAAEPVRRASAGRAGDSVQV